MRPCCAIEGVDPGELLVGKPGHLGHQADHAPLAVLRGARIESERSRVEADVAPLQAEHLGSMRPEHAGNRHRHSNRRSTASDGLQKRPVSRWAMSPYGHLQGEAMPGKAQ